MRTYSLDDENLHLRFLLSRDQKEVGKAKSIYEGSHYRSKSEYFLNTRKSKRLKKQGEGGVRKES